MAVANGDLTPLIISGQPTTTQLDLCWDAIVEANNRATGSNNYANQTESLERRARLIADYMLVRLRLANLYYRVDPETIAWLNAKGYPIVTTTRTAFIASITDANNRVENLLSKIASVNNELARMKVNRKEQPKTVGQLIASVSMELGFRLPNDVTLAEYNDYCKMLKAKLKQKTKKVA